MATHPKTAHLGPRVAYEKNQAELADARAELLRAQPALRTAERFEGEMLLAFTKACPAPSAEEVYREKLARETAAKMERVAKGLPPEEPKVEPVGLDPITLAARNRPRQHPHIATASPLRNNTVRRIV